MQQWNSGGAVLKFTWQISVQYFYCFSLFSPTTPLGNIRLFICTSYPLSLFCVSAGFAGNLYIFFLHKEKARKRVLPESQSCEALVCQTKTVMLKLCRLEEWADPEPGFQSNWKLKTANIQYLFLAITPLYTGVRQRVSFDLHLNCIPRKRLHE